MKKNFIFGAFAVAAMALFSCNKEQDFNKVEEREGIPFEFTAGTVDTKTANAGLSTTWVAGDQISLFHAVKDAAASTAVNDGAFTALSDGTSVSFSGNLADALDASSNYDWYAIYPYESGPQTADAFSYVTIGSPSSGTQVQTGNDSKAHLAGVNYPLYGKKKNVAASTKPSISLNQMSSIIEVKVTNKIASAIKVSKVQFYSSADNELIGQFRVDLSGDTPVFTSSVVNSVATLSVESADALAKDGSASYFFAVKPFTATPGSKITIIVTTDQGLQESSNIVPAKFDFLGGKIHTLNLNFINKNVGLAEFKYNEADWLTGQSITLPSTGSSTNLNGAIQTVGPINVSSTDGTTKTRVYNASGSYDLRVYNGGSISVAATGDNYISKITFNGKTITNLGLATANTWTGKEVCVSLPATGTANIYSINVFYQAAEATDHLFAIPVTSFNVPYSATSQAISFHAVNVDDLIISSSSEGYIDYSVAGNVITVNFTANTGTSSRDIVINAISDKAGYDEDITITQAGAPNTISTLTNGSVGTVTAQVAALATNGFILADNTGAIFVYKSGTGVSLGQTVTVSGTVGNYAKGLQFPSASTVTKGATGTFSYGTPAAFTETEISAWNNNDDNRLASYVTMTGVVKKNGSNYDLIVGGGATANVTFYSPVAAHTTGLAEGDNVTVTGYAINVMSSKCGVVPTEVVNNEVTPKIVFDHITGVAAAGVSGATLTVTPYRIDGWTPIVTKTGCVSAASINAACTTVTYSVSNNESTSAQSGTIVVTFQKSGESDVVYTINVAQQGKAAGTEVTIIIGDYAAAHSWENTKAYSTITVDSNITLTGYVKGNNNKYYDSNKSWRQYEGDDASITLTATNGATLKSVSFTYAQGNNGAIVYNSTNYSSGSDITLSGTSAAFTVTHTSGTKKGNVQITQIKVVYE